METLLYHYTSVNGLQGIISKGCIFCTDIHFLNDPGESTYSDSVIEEFLQNETAYKEVYDLLYNKSFAEAVIAGSGKYITSFSKYSDTLPMWNYYSRGNGYNIGILIDNLIDTNKSRNLWITKNEIVYRKDEQFKEIKNFLQPYFKEIQKFRDIEKGITKCRKMNDEDGYFEFHHIYDGYIEEFNNQLYLLKHRFKDPAYENEGEVRLIVEPNRIVEPDHEFIDFQFRTTEKGLIIPYFELQLNPKKDIQKITMHPLMNELHENGLKEFLFGNYIYNKDIVIKSSIPFREL